MGKLADQIKCLRQNSGVTVRDLAARIGKSPGYISRIEGRGEIPSPELLCLLAEVFGVTPESLLELAAADKIADVAQDIERRHTEALNLYRKEKR